MPRVWKSQLRLAILACLALAGCSSSEAPPPEEQATASSEKPAAPKTKAADEPIVLEEPNTEYYPIVALKTSFGELTLKLDAKRAPRTVNNFLHYVQSGHYDQTIFHQVQEGYVVLGGSYAPDLTEKDGRYPIPNEADNGLKNVRGTIAMARQPDEIDSATCQFFINLDDNTNLDHRGETPEEFGFCVFGEVIKGMEVLDKMSRVQVEPTEQFEQFPVETVLLETARRTR
ncbi:MAG TPA: peptidylprolyl isomerase [Pirellulales bacterium]|nr:peptidylprolyl isomerase [Pirellulales bacterium]